MTIVFDEDGTATLAEVLRPGSGLQRAWLAAAPGPRAELLSWLMFVAMGVGSFCGKAVHFEHFAPGQVPYVQKRCQFEARWHFRILDERLARHRYLVADDPSIVDMSFRSWVRLAPFIMGEVPWQAVPNIKRFHDEIAARPAAQDAATFKDRHPLKAEVDEETRSDMFRHQAA